MPSAFISQNEIDAAKTVHFDYLNVQDQPKIVWPASFALARAYLDQLERENSPRPPISSLVRALVWEVEQPRFGGLGCGPFWPAPPQPGQATQARGPTRDFVRGH